MLTSVSYLHVFNHFPASFEDAGWAQPTEASSSGPATPVADVPTVASSTTGQLDGLALRPSVRDSIVNFNAFQKVFRSRLDEGRAHANAAHFSNVAQAQPFLNDFGVPYTDLLGKNRTSYFSSPLYLASPVRGANTLQSAYSLTTTQAFEFPFMDALRSDLLRYIWMDGYSKWVCVDVQPASVSRYSTIGVPYLRRPYDFNTGASEEFSDTQTYFTRASRNRKNYLPV